MTDNFLLKELDIHILDVPFFLANVPIIQLVEKRDFWKRMGQKVYFISKENGIVQ